jgi:hypothetical protein
MEATKIIIAAFVFTLFIILFVVMMLFDNKKKIKTGYNMYAWVYSVSSEYKVAVRIDYVKGKMCGVTYTDQDVLDTLKQHDDTFVFPREVPLYDIRKK